MTLDLPADWPILIVAALLVAGVLAGGLAHRLQLPGLLLFLGLGMAIGDDGLGVVSFDDPTLAVVGGTVALLLILYEGGLTTKPTDLRQAALPGLLLATIGVLLTAFILGAGTYLLLDVEPITALLIGSVVASTDAAAVFAVLRRSPLPRRLTTLLEVESGSNDPMAIMLTVGLLETWRAVATPGPVDWVVFAIVQLAGGLAVGAALGFLGSRALSRLDLGPAGSYIVLALGIAGLSYGAAAAIGASGFLAVYVAGLFVGARVPLHRRGIRTFHQGLANTAEVGLFLMLGVLVFPSQLPAVMLPGLAVAAILTLIARPVAVAACLLWFRPAWQDLTFVAWAGLRGAVPIVLATLPFVAGHPDGDLIFDMVFFVVLVSALLQGASIRLVARWLRLRSEQQQWATAAEAVPISDINAELVEIQLTEDHAVTGQQVRDAVPPRGLISTIIRGGRVQLPTARTRLRAGDVLVVAAPPGPVVVEEIVAWARDGASGQPGGSTPDASSASP
jgi:potassium/hydrogen antiporter